MKKCFVIVLAMVLMSCSAKPKRDTNPELKRDALKTCTKEEVLAYDPRQASFIKDLKVRYKSAEDKVYNDKLLRLYVQLTFDCNKRLIFNLYNRQLRKARETGKGYSDLTGKILFDIEFRSSGAFENVYVVSSEIRDKEFLRELPALIKRMHFPQGMTGPTTVSYPLEFLAGS